MFLNMKKKNEKRRKEPNKSQNEENLKIRATINHKPATHNEETKKKKMIC